MKLLQLQTMAGYNKISNQTLIKHHVVSSKGDLPPMSTTQIAAALFQLQQLDLELERLVAELQSVVNSLEGSSKLQKLRAEHDLAQQQLRAGLQAQQEAQRLRAQQSRKEETALEVMDSAESLQEMARQKAEELEQEEKTWGEESASLRARRNQLEVRQQELQGRRAQLAGTIEPRFVNRYDVMRRTKQGRAVSKVDQNSCQWCRVILTPSELQRVRVNTDLQMCSNCGRILYYDR